MGEEGTPLSDLEQVQEEFGRLMLEGLGRAVIAWSLAEQAHETMLAIFLTAFGMRESEASLVGRTIDSRDRAALINSLGFRLVGTKSWFEELADLNNRFAHDLRNQRNRMLHDAWAQDKGAFSRRSTSKPKLTRPESRKLELVIPKFEPVQVQEISDFTQACLGVARSLLEFNDKLVSLFAPKSR